MATAVFGKKKQMTRAFQDDGTLVGVTVIEVEPNLVTAVRTPDDDGYEAVSVGLGAGRRGAAAPGRRDRAPRPPPAAATRPARAGPAPSRPAARSGPTRAPSPSWTPRPAST